jgi:hypothetical protein
MKSAAIAAMAVALACCPRLALWPNRSYPIWYLEAILLLGGFVLWAFVFAWHTKYSGRPVFAFKPPVNPFVLATLAGIVMAAVLHGFVDPLFRAGTPEDYPADFRQWIAMTLFSLGFTQLFLVFAPFDWSLRLSRRRWFAILFTVLFGVFVLVVKTRSSATELAPSLFWLLIFIRSVISILSVWFYSRHGVVLVWWWGFVLQTRHLLSLAGDA